MPADILAANTGTSLCMHPANARQRYIAVFPKSHQHVCFVRRRIQMSDVGFVKIISIWCLSVQFGRRSIESIREICIVTSSLTLAGCMHKIIPANSATAGPSASKLLATKLAMVSTFHAYFLSGCRWLSDNLSVTWWHHSTDIWQDLNL